MVETTEKLMESTGNRGEPGMDKRFLFYLEDMDSDKYSFEKTRKSKS